MENKKKELLDAITVNYTKNTFNIDSEIINYIEKNKKDDDLSIPETINVMLCDAYGITEHKIEDLVEFFRIKLEENNLDQFQSLIYYAQIDRTKNIGELIEVILENNVGKIQKRRLNIMMKNHFEDLKSRILEVFDRDLKDKVNKIRNGEI